MVNKASRIVHLTQAMKAHADNFPALMRIGNACLPHCAFMHTGKNGVGQLEHIRQALLRRLLAGTQEFFPVDIVLHRLEFGGSEFGIGRIHKSGRYAPAPMAATAKPQG
jgi:hypothetical protein